MELCRPIEGKAKLCTGFLRIALPGLEKQATRFGRYQSNLKPALMRLLLVACPKSVTAVVTCKGP
jgi:hypothetical protein